MSRLLLIRHGRTEGPLHDRDRIGDVGRDESIRTAAMLVTSGLTVTHAFTGPANRHVQTLRAMEPTFHAAQRPLPEVRTVDTLDEYDAPAIFDHLLPTWLSSQGLALPEAGTPIALDRKAYDILDGVGTAWATGALQHPQVETWPAFQARCVRGFQQITDIPERGAVVICTTSAGTIAAIVGHLLELSPVKAFGLSLVVRNASVTEVRFSAGRATLFSFNGTPPESRQTFP